MKELELKKKYLKYKLKYLNLKKQFGGVNNCEKCVNINPKNKLYNSDCQPENEINPTTSNPINNKFFFICSVFKY